MLRVIRFNWPKLLGGLAVAITASIVAVSTTGGAYRAALIIVVLGAAYFVLSSLVATWLVYDIGGVEKLAWFIERHGPLRGDIASIHVGYDDIRAGLENAAGPASVTGLFYPTNANTRWHGHSLERAIQHDDRTSELHLKDAAAAGRKFDLVVFGFTAHEVRDREERREVLGQARELLNDGGAIAVIEHLRDIPNVAVYGPGAWHFIQGRTWLEDFASVGLEVLSTRRVNGLIREFTLGVAANGESRSAVG